MQTPKRGDPLAIDARDWTEVLELIKKQRNGEIVFDLGDLQGINTSATRVKIVNDGTALSQCAVVGLGNPIITPNLNEQEFVLNFAFRSTTPTYGKWGIMQEPCPEDEIATAVIAGVTAAKIDVVNEDHQCADQDGSANLVSQWCGNAQILWKESGLGVKWAIVHLKRCGPRWFVGIVDGAIAGGATGTVIADSIEYDVKNEATETVPDMAKVGVSWDDLQNLYVISMEFC